MDSVWRRYSECVYIVCTIKSVHLTLTFISYLPRVFAQFTETNHHRIVPSLIYHLVIGTTKDK